MLALPLQTGAGAPFPQRDLLILLTFAAILATLVGQGLTLAPLVRLLGMSGDTVRSYLATPDLSLRVPRMPPYSPDSNPDEAIWARVRQEVMANT